MTNSLYAAAPLLTAGLTSTACGWGYARQMEKTPPRTNQSARNPYAAPVAAPVPQAPKAQVVPHARDLATLSQNHVVSQHAIGPNEMGLHAFTARLVDGMNDARQLIHCSSGKVIRFEKKPPPSKALENLKLRKIPAGEWIVEFDPTGQNPNRLNNDWYRHIVKHHRLEYVGANPLDQTVVYRYLGPRQGAGVGP